MHGLAKCCLSGWAVPILARVLHVLVMGEVLCEGALLGRLAPWIQASHLEVESVCKHQEADVWHHEEACRAVDLPEG